MPVGFPPSSGGGGGASPGGSTSEVQYNAGSGNFGGISGATTDGTNLTFGNWVGWSAISAPAAPSSGVREYAVSWAGTVFNAARRAGLPEQITPPALLNHRIVEVRPISATTISTIGCGAATLGTASTPTLASTNFYTQSSKFLFTTTATANTSCGWRAAALNLWRGNASGLGGFFVAMRVGVETIVSDGAFGAGLSSATGALPAGGPSNTLTDFIGIEKQAADTNWFFARRTGSGTAVRVDLGTAVAASQMLEVFLASDSNGSEIRCRVDVFDTGGVRTTLLDTAYSSDIPANTTFLGMRNEMRTGAGTTAVSVATCYGWAIGGA
jgi:hypothetical protein